MSSMYMFMPKYTTHMYEDCFDQKVSEVKVVTTINESCCNKRCYNKAASTTKAST
jgi:hypothetical protein